LDKIDLRSDFVQRGGGKAAPTLVATAKRLLSGHFFTLKQLFQNSTMGKIEITEEQKEDFVAFLQSKRILKYLSYPFILIIGLFGFFGFNTWSDLTTKTKETTALIDSSKSKMNEIQTKFKEQGKDAEIQKRLLEEYRDYFKKTVNELNAIVITNMIQSNQIVSKTAQQSRDSIEKISYNFNNKISLQAQNNQTFIDSVNTFIREEKKNFLKVETDFTNRYNVTETKIDATLGSINNKVNTLSMQYQTQYVILDDNDDNLAINYFFGIAIETLTHSNKISGVYAYDLKFSPFENKDSTSVIKLKALHTTLDSLNKITKKYNKATKNTNYSENSLKKEATLITEQIKKIESLLSDKVYLNFTSTSSKKITLHRVGQSTEEHYEVKLGKHIVNKAREKEYTILEIRKVD
jgi:hypothetical protein